MKDDLQCRFKYLFDVCEKTTLVYAAKSEPRSSVLTNTFNSVINNVDCKLDPHKAMEKVIMKTVGQRDFSA